MGKLKPGAVVAARIDPEMRRILDSNREIITQINALRPKNENVGVKRGDWFRIENVSAEEASVYIYDEIGFWGTTASDFVDQLNAITTPKLNVHINSPGGEVFDGVAIHSALMAKDAHITVYIDGLAASAASFIAMAGDRIVMARHATMMIHDASGLCWGNPADMRTTADLLDKLSDNVADMYALQAGGTVEEWRNRMRAETWYTGTEALAAGLVDEITQPDPDEPSNASPARLSLAAFKFANRAEAPDPLPPVINDPETEQETPETENEETPEEETTPETPVTDTLDHEERKRALAMVLVASRL